MKSNGIVQRQNTSRNIARLASQRQLYNDVGVLDRVNVVLSVIIPLGFTVIQEIAVEWRWAKTVSGCLSIAMLVLSLAIASQGNTKKTLAAAIQQEFDVDVFQMPWDDRLFGKRKDRNNEIARHSKKILNDRKEKDKLYNWYRPEVDVLPLNNAIVTCQKENFSWDAGLRKRYRIFSCILIAVIIVAPVSVCLFTEKTVQELLLRFVMILPALRWFVNIVDGLNNDLKRMESLESAAYSIEEKKIADLQFIQKEIFENRKAAVKIPNWFYSFFRDNDEDRERRSAELSE